MDLSQPSPSAGDAKRERAIVACKLSVVIPMLDEAENVLPLLGEVEAALTSLPLSELSSEIVVVDDGSRDQTPERLAEAKRTIGRLRVVRHKARAGQSTALWTGIDAAHGAWIATLDGDGQNDPADIRRLYMEIREGEARDIVLVTGVRRMRRDSLIKRLSSRIANAVRGRMLGDRVPDTGCGLKLFRRRDYLELPRFDHMHRFLPALMGGRGKIVLVDVNHRARTRGRSKYGTLDRLWVGLADLIGVMWLKRRMIRPSIERKDD